VCSGSSITFNCLYDLLSAQVIVYQLVYLCYFPIDYFGVILRFGIFYPIKVGSADQCRSEAKTELVLPVQAIQRVFARKAGFTPTDVALVYQNHSVTFEETRTNFFAESISIITRKNGLILPGQLLCYPNKIACA
jgi:hypothetical protein